MLIGLSAALYALVTATAWWDTPDDIGTGLTALGCGALAGVALRAARRARRTAETIENGARARQTTAGPPSGSDAPIRDHDHTG